MNERTLVSTRWEVHTQDFWATVHRTRAEARANYNMLVSMGTKPRIVIVRRYKVAN